MQTRALLPKEKVFVALSIPQKDVDEHIKAMQDVQCHLTWVDVAMIDHVNYFNFLWMRNTNVNSEKTQASKAGTSDLPPNAVPLVGANTFPAEPPRYLIFYDMNTAQMAQLYHTFTTDKCWNLELIESYLKVVKPITVPRKTQLAAAAVRPKSGVNAKHPAAVKSYEEIFYICQFRNCSGETNPKLNQLQHGVIDTQFGILMRETVKNNYMQLCIPIRVTPLLLNVNTVTNKHFYYTSLYKTIDYFKLSDDECSHEADFSITPSFCFRKNLDDTELHELYQEFNRNNWKLVDLKAYKTETGVSKFAAVWTIVDGFIEGTSIFFIGLGKVELLNKVHELSAKKLYPRVITNYGYLNVRGEHVYAVLFSQF